MANETWPQGLSDELKLFLEWLSVEQKNELLKILMKEKEERWEIKEELIWFEAGVLNDIRKNYVTIDEDVEMMWYKWRRVHIDLPKVWNVNWFKFDCFILDMECPAEHLDEVPELIDKSYSREEITGLLRALNMYMHAYWVKMWGKYRYVSDFENCFWYAGHCLKEILNFTQDDYYVKDVDEEGHHIQWSVSDGWFIDGGLGAFLLKLSD